MINYKPEVWLLQRPQDVIDHFNITQKQRKNKNYLLAKSIEQSYGFQNQRLVLPLSFAENIIAYSYTHNKNLIQMNSKTLPSGIITTIRKFLEDSSSEPIPFPPGCVRVVFDNEQTIGKRYRIHVSSPNVPLPVITSHAYIVINNKNDVESFHHLSPRIWRNGNVSEKQKKDIFSFAKAQKNHIRISRNKLLKSR